MNEIVEDMLRCNCASMTCLKIEDSLGLQTLLRERGYHVSIAELEGAKGETEMFMRIVGSLPLGNYYLGWHKGINMASLADLMIDILGKERKLALIVLNADELVEHHLNMLLTLFSIFTLQTNRSKRFDSQSLITTFLIGQGPNFREKWPEKEKTEVEAIIKERPVKRTPEQVKQDREEHWKRLKEGALPWQQNMTGEQTRYLDQIIKLRESKKSQDGDAEMKEDK